MRLDTGSAATLQNFVYWARGTFAGSQRTMLSIVGHGGGWSPDAQAPQAMRLADAASTASVGDAHCGEPMRGFSAWRPYMWPVKVVINIGLFLTLLQATATWFNRGWHISGCSAPVQRGWLPSSFSFFGATKVSGEGASFAAASSVAGAALAGFRHVSSTRNNSGSPGKPSTFRNDANVYSLVSPSVFVEAWQRTQYSPNPDAG